MGVFTDEEAEAPTGRVIWLRPHDLYVAKLWFELRHLGSWVCAHDYCFVKHWALVTFFSTGKPLNYFDVRVVADIRENIFCGKYRASDLEEMPVVDVVTLILEHFVKWVLCVLFRVWFLLHLCIFACTTRCLWEALWTHKWSWEGLHNILFNLNCWPLTLSDILRESPLIISGFYNFLKAIPVIYKLSNLYFNQTREGGIILDQFLCSLLMILMCFMNWENKNKNPLYFTKDF